MRTVAPVKASVFVLLLAQSPLMVAASARAAALPAPAHVLQINAYQSPAVLSAYFATSNITCPGLSPFNYVHLDVPDSQAVRQRMAETLYTAFFMDKPIMATYECLPDASNVVRPILTSVQIP